MIRPLKRFGQNYLQDENIIRKIIDEINPKKGENILEIGPGKGALTKYLNKSDANLTIVEIDKRVIADLQVQYKNANVIQSDFLNIDLCKFTGNKLRIVGNIPYNITSSIIFKMLEHNTIVNDAVFMVQYEVAKRMVSNSGSRDYGILSVLLKYFTETKLVFKVSPNVFYPKPKIFSAIVHLYFKPGLNDQEFNKYFILLVKSAFSNRRKTLKNSLSNGIFAELNFGETDIDLSLRAEQLDKEQFIELTKYAMKNIHLIKSGFNG